MTANNSTTDGLGFEEVNQATQTDIISGNNVYATTAVTTVTLTSDDCNSTNFTGLVGSIGVLVNDDGLIQSVGVGSKTSVYGASIQAGSSTLTAGSNLWKSFSTAFTSGTTSTPIVTVTNLTSTDGIMVGSLHAGSFYAEGVNASDEFSWIAVGL